MENSELRLIGCRQHNLKNISLTIPKQVITVLTGVSGSGKSSLAFDTLFAEGQRRYLEFLSPQARSLIRQMPKPDADLIEGLSPTLAVGQGRTFFYSQGIIATYTDIYDFLSLLYVKIGEQHSPTTGQRLIRYSRQEIIDLLLKNYLLGSRLQLMAPIKLLSSSLEEAVRHLQQRGFIRFKIDGKEFTTEDPLPAVDLSHRLDVIIDRLEMKEGIRQRLSHSVETAMDLSGGILKVQEGKEGPIQYFTEIYVCPETSFAFPPLSISDFNFNSPKGACPICEGRGGQERVDPHLFSWQEEEPIGKQVETILDAFPKRTASLLKSIWESFVQRRNIDEETIAKKTKLEFLKEILEGSSIQWDMQVPHGEEKNILVQWRGLFTYINEILQEAKSKGSISSLSFIHYQLCPACQGARLKPESLACLIKGQNIWQLCHLTVSQLIEEIKSWSFSGKEERIAQEVLPPVVTRLQFLEQVGLGYLSLDRPGHTLSDGEKQRIQLASQIGAKLSGIIYILDEPSLGLHRQDIQHLAKTIFQLKELGNTVILVEHERSLIAQADHIIELGPGAGLHGGSITFQGSYADLLKDPHSLTGRWLSGQLSYPSSLNRKRKESLLKIRDASLHNLKHFSVDIPLNCLVGLCGVSGSGKSTLALDVLSEEVRKKLRSSYSALVQGGEEIQRLVVSEKQEERFSARSIPATYVNLMTPLRELFAQTRLAKARGYTPARFSLNKKGGRCEVCEGLGTIQMAMQMMPDLFVPCEVCQGLRYNYETLQVTWEDRNIAEILNMTVEEAADFFKHIPSLAPKLQLMKELGLEYLALGQHFNTLSGGEIQRLKLVADLGAKGIGKTLYVLDEPSAGLHFQDIEKLMRILHRLVDEGHSVIIIEHHLDMLKQADWLIELGPGGGPQGGYLLFEGPPNKLKGQSTPTGKVLEVV